MKIAYCSSEVFPFAKTGGLGDVGGSLTLALEEAGSDVAIFMPGYRSITQSGYVIKKINDHVSTTTIGKNVNVYFIDHQKRFDREGFYGDDSGEYSDNLERFSYYCHQVLKFCKELEFQPDIVHCHDWHAALIPVLLKEKYKEDDFYAKTRTLLTIHNLSYQGVFPKEQFSQIGLDQSLQNGNGFEFHDQINLLKAGIIYGDQVTTVSPQYAKEIQTKQFGCGLQDVIHNRNGNVKGILNGLDYNIWDPRRDEHIDENYSKDDYCDAKLNNKKQLQKELGLSISPEKPLFGFVGRLSHQKGIELILDIASDLIKIGGQIALLGMGDAEHTKQIERLASENPENVAVYTTQFNEPLGHRIYAGSDFFLMPSRFEPCGLSQMISLCYGTIPICYKTGGLIDTISPFNIFNQKGNGLVFNHYSRTKFLQVIKKAIKIFKKKNQFDRLRQNAFDSKFTWEHSAHQYQELYQCA